MKIDATKWARVALENSSFFLLCCTVILLYYVHVKYSSVLAVAADALWSNSDYKCRQS